MKRLFLIAALILAPAYAASAHFIYVVPSQGGATAEVVFSEDFMPDGDVDITKLKDMAIFVREGKGEPVELNKELGKHLYKIAIPAGDARVIFGSLTWGVYQHGDKPGSLLTYYPKALVGDPFDNALRIAADYPVELTPVGEVGAVRFQLHSQGSPVAGAKVTVFLPDGHSQEVVTDADGLTQVFTQTGEYAMWSRATLGGAGEHDGKAYAKQVGYATLCVAVGQAVAPAPSTPEKPDGPMAFAKPFGTLPIAVASFGAVADAGYLYVYGGHVARTHTYDTEAVSGDFYRKDLASKGNNWEHLPGGPALQGMNLAAHNGMIYRVGGMQPRNARGDKADNYSVADCTRYNPQSGQWEWLAPMPEGRSSHDVAVVGDKLYVIGGWMMNGRADGNDWPEDMLVLDLAASRPVWKRVAQPFARRALIVAVHQEKIYAIGGMDDLDDISRRVDIFDPATQTWSQGPDLIGASGHAGFAPAACVVDGKLYASVAGGELLQLSDTGDAWEKIGNNTPRIVHRLAPWQSQILVIGGADKGGNLDLIEAVDPTQRKAVASAQ